ncbi:hypothetical protein D910_09526 [Dendroctonus ponderosae]
MNVPLSPLVPPVLLNKMHEIQVGFVHPNAMGEQAVHFTMSQPFVGLHEVKVAKPLNMRSKDTFNASIDVLQFSPEEIMVKVTVDKMIIVEGKQEDKQDENGLISRHFVRKYFLPEQFDAEQIQSTLSDDGILNITAPKRLDIKEGEYKEIPITLVGAVKHVKGCGHYQAQPQECNHEKLLTQTNPN